MNICVAGLGLIGGSICMSLKRAGYAVSGWNRSEEAVDFALSRGIIDRAVNSFGEFDVVFVALPPEATVSFMENTLFKDGAIVSDICGVKEWVEREVYSRPRNFRYVGCHPMAGKEVSTVKNSCADLFDRASMVITLCEKTDKNATEIIEGLVKDMGFARIVECSAAVHDKKIAYTSQLAHIVSNAYVKNPELDGCIGFTGGSFQDMTRIAGVDEKVWASLYLKNSKNLSGDISRLIHELEEIRSALDGGSAEELEEVLGEGRSLFEARRDRNNLPDGIRVICLK